MFKSFVLALALVAVASAQDPDGIANELASIDFGNMIGGPLNAAVEADAKAAMTAADFVKSVGFQPAPEDDPSAAMEPIYVKFLYSSTNADGTSTSKTIQVPFLTMLHIPSLHVESVEIEFNAKINSVNSNSYEGVTRAAVSTSASGGFFGIRASFRASFSHQSKKTSGHEIKRDYSLRVLVKATQADLPEGSARILDALLSSITANESSS